MSHCAEQASRNARTHLVEQLDLSAKKLGLLLDKLRSRMEQEDGTEDDPGETLGSLLTVSRVLKERCQQIFRDLDEQDEEDCY